MRTEGQRLIRREKLLGICINLWAFTFIFVLVFVLVCLFELVFVFSLNIVLVGVVQCLGPTHLFIMCLIFLSNLIFDYLYLGLPDWQSGEHNTNIKITLFNSYFSLSLKKTFQFLNFFFDFKSSCLDLGSYKCVLICTQLMVQGGTLTLSAIF